MIERIALWALFSFGAGISGWRAAAGRDGRIDKCRYFARAYLEGFLAGQVAFALVAGLAMLLSARDPSLAADYDACATRLLVVYVPYAALVLSTFAVRVIPSVDLRSATSVLVFAPADLAQPVVVVGGVAYAIAARPRVEVVLVGVAAVVASLGLGPLLDRRRRAQ